MTPNNHYVMLLFLWGTVLRSVPCSLDVVFLRRGRFQLAADAKNPVYIRNRLITSKASRTYLTE